MYKSILRPWAYHVLVRSLSRQLKLDTQLCRWYNYISSGRLLEIIFLSAILSAKTMLVWLAHVHSTSLSFLYSTIHLCSELQLTSVLQQTTAGKNLGNTNFFCHHDTQTNKQRQTHRPHLAVTKLSNYSRTVPNCKLRMIIINIVRRNKL